MRRYAPFLFVLGVLVTAVYTLFGDDSYSKLVALRSRLEVQQSENKVMTDEVRRLRKEVTGVLQDDRELEKAARNELAMARHGEVIYLFDQYIDGE